MGKDDLFLSGDSPKSSSRVRCQPFLASLSPIIFVLRFFLLSLFVLFRLIIQNFSTSPYVMHLNFLNSLCCLINIYFD